MKTLMIALVLMMAVTAPAASAKKEFSKGRAPTVAELLSGAWQLKGPVEIVPHLELDHGHYATPQADVLKSPMLKQDIKFLTVPRTDDAIEIRMFTSVYILKPAQYLTGSRAVGAFQGGELSLFDGGFDQCTTKTVCRIVGVERMICAIEPYDKREACSKYPFKKTRFAEYKRFHWNESK